MGADDRISSAKRSIWDYVLAYQKSITSKDWFCINATIQVHKNSKQMLSFHTRKATNYPKIASKQKPTNFHMPRCTLIANMRPKSWSGAWLPASLQQRSKAPIPLAMLMLTLSTSSMRLKPPTRFFTMSSTCPCSKIHHFVERYYGFQASSFFIFTLGVRRPLREHWVCRQSVLKQVLAGSYSNHILDFSLRVSKYLLDCS